MLCAIHGMCNSFVMEIERMEKELDHLKVVGYIFGQQNLFIFRFYGEMGVIDYEQKRNFKIWIERPFLCLVNLEIPFSL